MRVTNATTYRNFTTGANDVHARLIKSYNKVSSGEAYESAADSPISYYKSQQIDAKYQDVITQQSLIKNVQNRIYQQELGARDIQSILSKAKDQVIYANTDTTNDTPLLSLRDDLLQKEHEIVDALNAQYQNLYVFGGNDISNPPFSLSIHLDDPDAPLFPDSQKAGVEIHTLTYTHTFPGETEPTVFKMSLGITDASTDPTTYGYKLSGTKSDGKPMSDKEAEEGLLKAMGEQGRIDLGYGSISDHNTLVDTYTGGINVLTGLTSDAVKGGAGNKATDPDNKDIIDYLNQSPLALIGRAVQAIDKYVNEASDPERTRTEVNHLLSQTITDMVTTEHRVSAVYSDLGNKYRLLDDTADKLSLEKNNLTEQYTDVWGADPYESIVEMYNSQQAYNAALKVGTNLMSSSLFDFMG